MTREQERRVRLYLRLVPTDWVREVVARTKTHDTPEAVMDELWTQKAALGEMLRRGEFDDTTAHTVVNSDGRT